MPDNCQKRMKRIEWQQSNNNKKKSSKLKEIKYHFFIPIFRAVFSGGFSSSPNCPMLGLGIVPKTYINSLWARNNDSNQIAFAVMPKADFWWQSIRNVPRKKKMKRKLAFRIVFPCFCQSVFAWFWGEIKAHLTFVVVQIFGRRMFAIRHQQPLSENFQQKWAVSWILNRSWVSDRSSSKSHRLQFNLPWQVLSTVVVSLNFGQHYKSRICLSTA